MSPLPANDTRHGLPTTEAMVENILRVYHASGIVERREGERWYPEAHKVAATLATRHGVSLAVASAVIALLSPSNRWERNVQDADTLLAASRAGLSLKAFSVSTYGTNKAKAWQLVERARQDGYLDTEAAFSERALKTRSFYRLILDPGADAVVIDGHAFCIAIGLRTPLSEVPNLVSWGRYGRLETAYYTAADRLGISPATVQAVTWVAWRNTHGV